MLRLSAPAQIAQTDVLEFLTHTNSCILTCELKSHNSILIGRNLSGTQINLPIIFIILYGITQDIHQKTLQMDWAAYKIFMNDLWCFMFHLDFSFIRLFDTSVLFPFLL